MTLFVRRVFGRTPGTRGRTGLRQCGQWRAGTRTRRRNAGSGWQSTRSRTSSAPPGKSASAPPQQGHVSGAASSPASGAGPSGVFHPWPAWPGDAPPLRRLISASSIPGRDGLTGLLEEGVERPKGCSFAERS